MIKSILGNIYDVGGYMCTRSIHNLQKDGLYKGDDGEIDTSILNIGYYRHIPTTMYRLLEMTYRRVCIEHKVILCTEELEKHGVRISWEQLLRDYQHKKRRCDVNRSIVELTIRIEKLGAQFASNALVNKEPNREDNDTEFETDSEHSK
jgi:hypothetical protein